MMNLLKKFRKHFLLADLSSLQSEEIADDSQGLKGLKFPLTVADVQDKLEAGEFASLSLVFEFW